MALPLDYRQRLQQILGGDADPLRDAVLGRLRMQESTDPQAASTLDPNRLVQPPLNGAWVNGQWVPLEEEPATATEPAPPEPRSDTIQAQLQQSQPSVDLRGALGKAATLGRRFLFGPTAEEMGLPADMPVLGPAGPAPIPGVRQGFDYVANLIDPPQGEGGYMRGLGAGMVQGLGNLVAGEADPLQAAGIAAGPKRATSIERTATERLKDVLKRQAVARQTQTLAEISAPPGILAEVQALFPRVDSYGKPASLLSRATILKRAETSSLSSEAKTALMQLADQIGDRRIQPAELHALAQGETYTPERVLRKVAAIPEGAKQIPGAPLGVSNARQARALRERYLQQMEQGVAGRDWYHEAGEAIFSHANEDPARANLVAGDMAIVSPTTSVGANTGMGIKGYNQATAGVPIEAGRYPTAMGKQIAELHAGGEGATGLKRSPFAGNIARGGGFLDEKDLPPRAVHDIWDAEAHGYVNPDASPMRTGFGPAQHRFMDVQQNKIIAAANARATGGFTDWDELRTQAAAWVGAKIQAGDIKPEDAAKSYADYLASHYAQGSRETIPGETTRHMPELHQPGMEKLRQQLHERITRESGIYDAQLRDQIAAGYGGLVGRSFEGPGLYQGASAPGRQTQVLTGSVEVPGSKGARVLDEGSRRILDASEATHSLLAAQDAGAYSRVLPAGSGQPRNAWEVTLPGGTITPAQMQVLAQHLGPGVADMVLVPTPDGIRLAYMDEATMKSAVKKLGGKVTTAGTLQGNLIGNDWRTQRVGQGYLDPIRTMGPEKFDVFAPPMAARLRDIDRRFARDTGGRVTLSPMIDEVRAAVSADGFAGLERLAKKYAIPVTLLAAAVAELHLDSPSHATGGAVPASDGRP